MGSPTKPTSLEIDFENTFNACVYMSFLGEGFLYSSKKNDSNIYELFSYEKDGIDKLMEQSLKEGKDLLLEACKDKEIIVTQEMKEKAEAEGVLCP